MSRLNEGAHQACPAPSHLVRHLAQPVPQTTPVAANSAIAPNTPCGTRARQCIEWPVWHLALPMHRMACVAPGSASAPNPMAFQSLWHRSSRWRISWKCACGVARCRHKLHGSFFDLPIEYQREYRPLLAAWFVQAHRRELQELDKRLSGDASTA